MKNLDTKQVKNINGGGGKYTKSPLPTFGGGIIIVCDWPTPDPLPTKLPNVSLQQLDF